MKYIKIKDSINLNILKSYGFKHSDNFNRGEWYERGDSYSEGGGVAISGDWGNRKISFIMKRENLTS